MHVALYSYAVESVSGNITCATRCNRLIRQACTLQLSHYENSHSPLSLTIQLFAARSIDRPSDGHALVMESVWSCSQLCAPENRITRHYHLYPTGVAESVGLHRRPLYTAVRLPASPESNSTCILIIAMWNRSKLSIEEIKVRN